MLASYADLAKTDPEAREEMIRNGWECWLEDPAPAEPLDEETIPFYPPEEELERLRQELRQLRERQAGPPADVDLAVLVEAALRKVVSPQVEALQKAADDLLLTHRVSGEKDWYSPEDISVFLMSKGWKGCSEYTVRESWCNKDGRIEAEKDPDSGY